MRSPRGPACSHNFFMGVRTVYSLLAEAAAKFGSAPALHQPGGGAGGAKYRVYGWAEYKSAVEEIACGLRLLGVGRGDVVALDSETRAEFYLADLGIMANGSIAAAMYTSLPPEESVKTLEACSPRAVFVENAKTLEALRQAGGDRLAAQWILLTGEAAGAVTLEALRRDGREAMRSSPDFFESIRAGVEETDPAILYLTSGATGAPKMGLVTHAALVANMDHGPRVLPLGPEDRALVFLPSAHIAQRVVLELVPIPLGIPLWFSEGLPKLPQELKEIRPTFFLAPPRVWERVYSSIYAEVRRKPAALRKLFYGAVGLGLEAARCREEGRPAPAWMRLPLKAADRLVFRQIRARLGGCMKIPASGAAPLSKDLARFYAAIGMPLIEGYGLTEGGIVAFNPPRRPKPGSIGTLLPGVEAKIAPDGELLLRSPCLFAGYYNDPEATRAVLRDGWLATGDIAEADADGYYYITGRKKELIVSSNGKKIYPARIEGFFKVEPLINHVVLVGDRLPYVTALITLNPAAGGEPRETVLEEVRRAVARVNRRLAAFEQIRKFRVLERDLTIERGELTPTMKVRRSKVLENHQPLIAEMYAGKSEWLND